MRRTRNAKIVATLGPASSEPAVIEQLFLAGVDVFRLNFSHGAADDHRARVAALRAIEQKHGRPIAILADLQGPKLRVGTFEGGPVQLQDGQAFRLQLDAIAGSAQAVQLPHPEIFAALVPGAELLLDDGKLRLKVERCDARGADTTVMAGGKLSDRKGVNVPGVVLPISALTEKDRRDLAVALELEVDWVALSFVQRPEDVHEARALVGQRAGLVAKLEKPAAIERLDEVIEAADAVMVARGDLGVEMPAESVPPLQKRIVRACRKRGKPVIVATQMLESMIESPVPTRAEASDVATAIYDGADAVMLSAESAAGKHPIEAVRIMNRIIERVEADPLYRQFLEASQSANVPGQTSVPDAVCCAMRRAVALLRPAAIVCATHSGATSLRVARERAEAPILSLTPQRAAARRLVLAWGVHSLHVSEVTEFNEVRMLAGDLVRREGFGQPGDPYVAIAGVPFGQSGTTNLMHIGIV
ncbi:MAG: pyruvate kinase [Proteobacteria bacterium]|nr:pyruvate kinase [Pseudomonadota bacterium]